MFLLSLVEITLKPRKTHPWYLTVVSQHHPWLKVHGNILSVPPGPGNPSHRKLAFLTPASLTSTYAKVLSPRILHLFLRKSPHGGACRTPDLHRALRPFSRPRIFLWLLILAALTFCGGLFSSYFVAHFYSVSFSVSKLSPLGCSGICISTGPGRDYLSEKEIFLALNTAYPWVFQQVYSPAHGTGLCNLVSVCWGQEGCCFFFPWGEWPPVTAWNPTQVSLSTDCSVLSSFSNQIPSAINL